MAILVVFWRSLWTNMAKLSPIDFKISLPLDVNVNDGENKFEVDISKHKAKVSNFWPKIGQLPLWRATFSWEYLGHFSSNFGILFF